MPLPVAAMRRGLGALGLLLALGAGAGGAAEAPAPLATYRENSGSLPPEHAWGLHAAIAGDGAVWARFCRGCETAGPACREAAGQAAPAALEALRAAAAASGLAERPAAADPAPFVGGPGSGGTVVLDAATIALPAFPAPGDRARVEAVLNVLRAALPPEVPALADGG